MIHDICYHGKGGYDYYTVYDMPIWLRKLTYNFIPNKLINLRIELKNFVFLTPKKLKIPYHLFC